ncbi:MAG: hypothetical protein JXR68_07555 [Bacteroidales bacterium]|nr:hypothetical protein [Bacteroidales bacterium]
MKKYLFLLAVVASVFIFSCNQVPSMTATIDGVSTNFMFRQSNKVVIPEVGDGMVILATTGIDSTDGEYLVLLVRGADQGTYDLSTTLTNGKLQCEAIYRPNDTTHYVAKSGSITITSITSKKVSGTFNLTLTNKVLEADIINITNGKFDYLRYFEADIADLANIALDF